MILQLILLTCVQSYYKEENSLVLTKDDMDILVSREILSQSQAEDVWEHLVEYAEQTNPSKISKGGFEKSSDTLLFGFVPIMSIVISLGSGAVLMCLFWVVNILDSWQNKVVSLISHGLFSAFTLCIADALYETYGIVIMTILFFYIGMYFFFEVLEDLIIFMGYKKLETSFELNPPEAIIVTIVSLYSYYYSFYIAFPFVQVPFFLGLVYLVIFFSKLLENKAPSYSQPLTWVALAGWSFFTIIYMALAGDRSFVFTGKFYFIDFRLIGNIVCSVIFAISTLMVSLSKYTSEFGLQLEGFAETFEKFSSKKNIEEWLPHHKYILVNMSMYFVMFFLGILTKSIPLIIVTFIFFIALTVFLPITKYSNIAYQFMFLIVVIFSSLIGKVNDSSSFQITAFYPNSYILQLGFFIIRVACVVIAAIIANKYRSTHYTVHSTFDVLADFVIGYIRAITMIVLSEEESNWVMSWIYMLGLLFNIEPTLKIDSSSIYDDTIRSYSLLLYGIRLSLISYNTYIAFYIGLLLVFIGFFRCKTTVNERKPLLYAYYAYLWLVLQFSCCLDSWLLLTAILVAFVAKVTIVNSTPQFNPSKIITTLVVLLILYFITSLQTTCLLTLHTSSFCSVLGTTESFFPEKQLILQILNYVR